MMTGDGCLAPEFQKLRDHIYYGTPMREADPFHTPDQLDREDAETEAVLKGLDTLIAELQKVRNDVNAGCGLTFIQRSLRDRRALLIRDQLCDYFVDWREGRTGE